MPSIQTSLPSSCRPLAGSMGLLGRAGRWPGGQAAAGGAVRAGRRRGPRRWRPRRRVGLGRQAGAAPLAALTALAANDALRLGDGTTVLVIGASGGVGSFAVQLAAHAGATVIAPGLPEDEDHLRGLGVAEIIDRDGDVAATVRDRYPDGVDALLDLVSPAPDALDAYAGVVRGGGRVVSSVGAAGEGPDHSNIGAVPSPANLERLARLLDAGTLSVPIRATYPLAQADQALK